MIGILKNLKGDFTKREISISYWESYASKSLVLDKNTWNDRRVQTNYYQIIVWIISH